MSQTLQAIRGMSDLLPDAAPLWQWVEDGVRSVVDSYGYREIRTPIVEKTELFKRSIGEVTDIVEKEMYTFDDRNGDSLTLRPEGTASCVRALLEHGLLQQPQRLWYRGPMFRHERPQKGRYRQFHQVGVESFGLAGPDIDAELILISARIWRRLGLSDAVTLQLNSLGSSESRAAYREVLVSYLRDHAAQLDEESRQRLERNPLRVLDSKNPALADLIAAAPQLTDHLDSASAEHFAALQTQLDSVGIAYQINPRLVRGLDYYSRTVFEWVTDRLGAQGTVCAGGRFDGLVTQLGGKPVAACGFAIGLERLTLLLADGWQPPARYLPHAYLVQVGEPAAHSGPLLAERLRDALPALRIQCHCGGGSFKSQLKRADRSGAPLALLLGDDEVANGVIGVKPLRGDAPQQQLTEMALIAQLRDLLATEQEES